MNRAPLSDEQIDRIRRDRIAPERTQWDYLHLIGLRDALDAALHSIPTSAGPALDLYCGTQPYREIVPLRPLWGYDLDRHYGGAAVLGGTDLPFRSGAFQLVLCTQALYQVDDEAATAEEIRRVTAPGGYAVITVPTMFRRELAHERRYDAARLRKLFSGWRDLQVHGIGGPGAGGAYFAGSLVNAAARRSRAAKVMLPYVSVATNGVGALVDGLLRDRAGRWPASLMLIAHR